MLFIIEHVQMPLINVLAGVSRTTTDLTFGLSFHLYACFVLLSCSFVDKHNETTVEIESASHESIALVCEQRRLRHKKCKCL